MIADRSSGEDGDAARAEGAEVIWHDLECGSYTADLALWEEMASECRGEVLDLGCGTGRVALHLARRGHRVLGVDDDAALVAALSRRSGEAGLPVTALRADVRELDLGRRFDLILAPM